MTISDVPLFMEVSMIISELDGTPYRFQEAQQVFMVLGHQTVLPMMDSESMNGQRRKSIQFHRAIHAAVSNLQCEGSMWGADNPEGDYFLTNRNAGYCNV